MSASHITNLVTVTVTPGADGYSTKIAVTGSGIIAPVSTGAAGISVAPGLTGVKIENLGVITGGAAGYGYAHLNLLSAGIGVALNTGMLANDGSISGGVGANEYYFGTPGGIGVKMSGGAVLNRGTIEGGNGGAGSYIYANAGDGGVGVQLSGGRLINQGIITGGHGGNEPDARYVGNYGGSGGNGVDLGSSQLTNTGTIFGGAGGIGIYSDGVYGKGGDGIAMQGGTLVNRGTIGGGEGGYRSNGGDGVFIDGGTLMNAGTIAAGAAGAGNDGTAGDAVKFGSASSTLIIEPGAVFDGDVAANAEKDDVLQLAGSKPSTLYGDFSAPFSGFTSAVVEKGANWTLDYFTSLGTGTSLVDDGTLQINGQLTLSALVSGSGTLTLGAESGLLSESTLGVAKIDFAGGGSTLAVTEPASFTSTITGFGLGDIIDLSSIQTKSLSFNDGKLTLYGFQGGEVDQLKFAGSYATANFTHEPDPHGGTLIGFAAT